MENVSYKGETSIPHMENVSYKSETSIPHMENISLRGKGSIPHMENNVLFTCPTRVLFEFHIFIGVNNSLWNWPQIVAKG